MNIFATDANPIICAYELDDIRVNKMITETCQMLSTVCHKYNISNSNLMAVAYPKHGCTIWAGHSRQNFTWLVEHLKGLLEVFDLFGNRYMHQRARELLSFFQSIQEQIPDNGFTEWYNATPFKLETCVWTIHERYMEYMCDKWKQDKRKPTWTNREIPCWYE